MRPLLEGDTPLLIIWVDSYGININVDPGLTNPQFLIKWGLRKTGIFRKKGGRNPLLKNKWAIVSQGLALRQIHAFLRHVNPLLKKESNNTKHSGYLE